MVRNIHIQQFSGIKRTEGKQPHQCADTFGAVLPQRAVFAYNNVFLQRGRYFLFQVIHLSLNRSSHSMISSVSFLFAPYLPVLRCWIVAGMLQSLAIWQQEVSKGLATTLQHIAGFYSALSAACDKETYCCIIA